MMSPEFVIREPHLQFRWSFGALLGVCLLSQATFRPFVAGELVQSPGRQGTDNISRKSKTTVSLSITIW